MSSFTQQTLLEASLGQPLARQCRSQQGLRHPRSCHESWGEMKCHQILTSRVVRLVMEELRVRVKKAGMGKLGFCGSPGEVLSQLGG